MRKDIISLIQQLIKVAKPAYVFVNNRSEGNVPRHDLRHYVATNLRRAGVDTTTAMQIIGHRSPLMRKRYNSVAVSDFLTAVNKLNAYHSNSPIPPADDRETVLVVSA